MEPFKYQFVTWRAALVFMESMGNTETENRCVNTCFSLKKWFVGWSTLPWMVLMCCVKTMWTLQGALVTSVTYLIPAQARSIIPALSRDCQMSNTSRATYYRQMFAGNSTTQYRNQEKGWCNKTKDLY